MMKFLRKYITKSTAILTMTLLLLLALSMSMAMTGCADEDIMDEVELEENAKAADYDSVDADSYTLMVYITGSDLESDNGCATTDINEILYAEHTDKLNVILQTGGAKEWQNSMVSADSVQRWKASDEGLELLDDIGQKQMTDAQTISDFIKFAKNNYPADRYGFIFWDHGGGTIGGYGADEQYEYAGMDVLKMTKGIADGGCHFDFIGFDCCLMGTVEIASALSDYADYLIASEETEPGSGWYYTNFVSELAADPGLPVPKFGKTIVEDFISDENTSISSGVTLSVVDLRKIDKVVEELYNYLAKSDALLRSGDFGMISNARSDSRSYGGNDTDQIDIAHYISRAGVEGAEPLSKALDEAVVVNGTNIAGSNGLAMYFPYSATEEYDRMAEMIAALGIDENDYAAFFNDFISIMLGGQMNGGGNVNPHAAQSAANASGTHTSQIGQGSENHQGSGSAAGGDIYSDEDEDFDWNIFNWFNDEITEEYNDNYAYVDSEELTITPKGDGYVLQLTDEEWDLITDIELQVYVNDDDGSLMLGSDDFYEFDEDGDLKVEYDYTWLDINGALVPYYADHRGERLDGTEFSVGYAPAQLNGRDDICLWILWSSDQEEPTVLGYTHDYGDNAVQAKGYKSFKDGDVIDFYFDFYDAEGEYSDAFMLEDNSIVYSESKGFDISYEEIGDVDCDICFYLKDIYGNEYWTEYLSYTD